MVYVFIFAIVSGTWLLQGFFYNALKTHSTCSTTVNKGTTPPESVPVINGAFVSLSSVKNYCLSPAVENNEAFSGSIPDGLAFVSIFNCTYSISFT